MDLAMASVGLIILSPILILISVMIKMSSPGPIFFKQERLGYRGKTFNILKFRTMVPNAEQVGDGIFVKSETDSRITRIGKLLRKTSLDELPQLINVIKGDMSLVGPRPPVIYHPYKLEDYSETAKRRFEMRPGITGLAQVMVRNSVPWEERFIYDIKYVDEFTILLDLKILAQTILKIGKKETIYKPK